MSKARRLATERIIRNAGIGSLKELNAILDDPDISLSETPFGTPPGEEDMYVKDAVEWKGDPSALPSAVRSGLQTAINRSQQAAGVTGTAVDPRTGGQVPRKVLAQRRGEPGGVEPEEVAQGEMGVQ